MYERHKLTYYFVNSYIALNQGSLIFTEEIAYCNELFTNVNLSFVKRFERICI